MPSPLKVGLHPALAPHVPEARYALTTLLRLAGYGWDIGWRQDADGPELDLFYGPAEWPGAARCRVDWCGTGHAEAPSRVPDSCHREGEVAYLGFGEASEPASASDGALHFRNDIVFATYWLLSGAAEPGYRRDRVDNLDLEGSFLLRHRLLETPLVSRYAQLLRRHFERIGREAEAFPWRPRDAAFCFTHDVDYPQIIRWIECLRLLASRRPGALSSVRRVLDGSSHFWLFSDWVELLAELGARPAFYFAAGRGSPLRYALGTPDVFYDVDSEDFRTLFRYLREKECEIGLHASYHVHSDEMLLFREKSLLEEASAGRVEGNRNHYWHLDPRAPNDTLRMHERAGFLYDSSLAFDFYPGFRRGICHPFRPFHPGERRELDILQLPPTWMDDHFDRRLTRNAIADPAAGEAEITERTSAHARQLLAAVRATGGVAVVDYHVRGLNADFFPRYGPWLRDFVVRSLDAGLALQTPGQVAADYARYESLLSRESVDRTEEGPIEVETGLEIGPLQAGETPAVARLHHAFFGDPGVHGASIATFGPRFLERAFYRPNLDNPYVFCDVARYGGEVVGWSVCTTRRDAFRFLFGRRMVGIALETARALLRRPAALVSVLANLRYFAGDRRVAEGVDGTWLVAGVTPRCRTPRFKRRAGASVVEELFRRMEATLHEHGCNGWVGSVRTGNPAIRIFIQQHGGRHVGTSRAQGVEMYHFVKRFEPVGDAGATQTPAPRR